MNRLWSALGAIALAACASMTTEKARESWSGASYEDVVRVWGAPARSGKLADGADVHTWVAEAGPAYRGSGASIGIGGFGGRGGSGVGVGVGFPIGGGSAAPPARCERTLTFRDGRLAEQSWIGADEVCAEYQRPK
jgi:hypothetical protein